MSSVKTAKKTSATRNVSTGKDQIKTVNDVIESLTKRWTATIGKSAEVIQETTAILADAKTNITYDFQYQKWLKEVAKMSESTASKYRSIHACEFLHDRTYTDQLPPDWTIWYELSKLHTAALFKKGVAFVVREIPTHAELANEVSGLLNKPKSNETLYRTGKLVTNNQKVVAEVNRQMAKAKEDAEKAKDEVKELKVKLASKAYEPTVEEIAEAQEMDFDDDSNIVRLEQFNKAYKALQRGKLERKIKALLHAEGLKNVEVIVRQLAAAKKAA